MTRRGAGAVELDGLENRCARKSTVGSNPTLSAKGKLVKPAFGIIELWALFLSPFFITIGSTTWIYTKFQRTTGNDTIRSLKASALSGIIIFVISLVILKMIMP